MFSLWQLNLTALVVERFFVAARLRSDAVALCKNPIRINRVIARHDDFDKLIAEVIRQRRTEWCKMKDDDWLRFGLFAVIGPVSKQVEARYWRALKNWKAA